MRWILIAAMVVLLAAPAIGADEPAPAKDPARDAETPVEEAPEATGRSDDSEIGEILDGQPEITIIGTRTERDVMDIPHTVVIIPRKTLLDTGRVVATKAISRRDPAIWYDERTYSTTDPIIRGFAGFNLLTLVDGNTLSTLWGEGGFGADDMYGKIDPETIERIDILLGPSSVLYGSNALGAVINVITRDSLVDYTEEGFAWKARAKFDYSSAAAGFASRLELHGATPELKFLLGGSYRDFDDVDGGRGLGTLDPTEMEEMNWDIAAEWKITEDRYLRGTFVNVQRDPTFRFYRPTQDNRNERRALALFYRDSDPDMFWDELNARVYYQYKKDRRHFYTDEDRDVMVKSGRAITETYAADAHLTKDVGGGHVLTGGISFELDDGDSPDDEQFTFTWPEPTSRDAPLSEWWNYAVYLQDEWEIDESFSVIGSARFDYFVFETDVDNDYRPESGDPDADDFRDTTTAFTGGLGVIYKATENVNLFASWARGFRQNAPNFGIRQLGDGVLIPNELLDETTSDNFEIGVKGRYSGLTFEWIVYYSLIENWQGDLRKTSYQGKDWYDFNDNGTRDANEDVVTQTEGGDAYVLGTEIRATVRPHVFWDVIPANYSVWGGFAWNKGRVDETDAHDEEEPLRHTQPMRGLVGVRWDDVENPKSGLYVEVVTDMVGRFDEIPTDRQASDLAWRRDAQDGGSSLLRAYTGTPGYVIVNAYAGVNLCDNARLKVAVENLTDRAYRVAHSRMDAPGIDFLVSLEIEF